MKTIHTATVACLASAVMFANGALAQSGSPDLKITGVSFINGPLEGVCNNLRVSIYNDSTVPVTGNFIVAFGEVSEGGFDFATQVTAAGGVGGKTTKVVSMPNIPYASNAYTASVSVDHGNAIAESSEANNVFFLNPTPVIGNCSKLSIADATGPEGGKMTFAVALKPAHPWATVSVNYATGNATAQGGGQCGGKTAADYVSGSGTLTFAKGETSKRIYVDSCPDMAREGSEIFNVTLSNASKADITRGTSTGTITE